LAGAFRKPSSGQNERRKGGEKKLCHATKPGRSPTAVRGKGKSLAGKRYALAKNPERGEKKQDESGKGGRRP